MHGEVRLFAVHGHHLGELLQLKCTERKGENSHRCRMLLCLSRNDAARLWSAPSAALSPEITEMPAVSETHLSVYCFPTAGDERGSYT